MVHERIQVAVFLLFVATASARGQLVQTGPPPPHYCQKLKVAPNLILKQGASISGRLIGQRGAPFQGSPSSYISTSHHSNSRLWPE